MERDQKFGRLLAIANVVGSRVYDSDHQSITAKHMTRFNRMPAKTITKIHSELMERADKFGADELHLMDMFGEIMASLDVSEFNNEPLNPVYLHGFHSQQHALNNIMGVEDAAKLWNTTPGYVKNLCAEGKIKAVKIGKTWVIDRNHPNPKQN